MRTARPPGQPPTDLMYVTVDELQLITLAVLIPGDGPCEVYDLIQ
jgi:hypothetical protein